MTVDSHKALSPHFQLHEFLHEGCSPESLSPTILANLTKLAHALENVRTQFGNQSIHINSGYRTVAHNKAVGGAESSQHLLGLAADLTIGGHTPHQVQKVLVNWPGGMGCYSTWTHLDLGPKRRWIGP